MISIRIDEWVRSVGSGVLLQIIELFQELLFLSPASSERIPQIVQLELAVDDLDLVECVVWLWILHIDMVEWLWIRYRFIHNLRRLVLFGEDSVIRKISFLSLGWWRG